jgi:hypothetical protein
MPFQSNHAFLRVLLEKSLMTIIYSVVGVKSLLPPKRHLYFDFAYKWKWRTIKGFDSFCVLSVESYWGEAKCPLLVPSKIIPNEWLAAVCCRHPTFPSPSHMLYRELYSSYSSCPVAWTTPSVHLNPFSLKVFLCLLLLIFLLWVLVIFSNQSWDYHLIIFYFNWLISFSSNSSISFKNTDSVILFFYLNNVAEKQLAFREYQLLKWEHV